MKEKINWALNVNVEGGPHISKSDIMDVDAYDKFEIVVETNGDVKVDVQPGAASNIRFVLITSNNYEDLNCKVDPTSTTKGPIFDLDGPVIMIGKGLASLLGSDIKQFEFVNKSSNAASISILIGRKATT